MRWTALALCAMIAGCATIEGGPKTMAENGCMFIFFAGLNPVHSLAGAAACTFGVEELKEKKDKPDVKPEDLPG